ncbi:DUF4124 domain-containing protein [Deefgea rivuli]|uniref:DUF4124 domain-containing protein n=1 Tax=Deefgea rivuli TaxID=400948 RepID=UPI00048309A0|nr:DUF4124 domain-containing protein [Deefgea rivuli]
MRWLTILFSTYLMLIPHVQAAIYKCTNAQGQVSFQEQVCPQNTTTKEVQSKGSRQLSIEEDAWVKERSNLVNGICNNMLEQKYGQHDLLRQACACTTKRYFSNPISTLRTLEATKNVQANKELIRKAADTCGKELLG